MIGKAAVKIQQKRDKMYFGINLRKDIPQPLDL